MVSTLAVSSAAIGGDITPDALMSRASVIASVIEITVGASPGYNHAAAASNAGLSVIAHHSFPASDGHIVNPDVDHRDKVLDAVESLGSNFYSLHPAKGLRGAELLRWAECWSISADRRGITLCFETMNPVSFSGRVLRPHSLDCGSEALALARTLCGSNSGLLADLSHILIGLRLGTWSPEDVDTISCTGSVLAMHVSSPTSVKDSHKPHNGDKSIAALRASLNGPSIMYEIDEGRRPRRAEQR